MPPPRPTHVEVHRLTHAHMHAHLVRKPYLGKKKKATGANRHLCFLHTRHSTHTPACTHTCTLTHVSTPAQIPVASLKSSSGSESQTLKIWFVPSHTLPAPILHMPTGLHSYVGLRTDSGFCPHSPPTYPFLLRSCPSPHRNPLVTCNPSLTMSSHTHDKDMSTP